LTKIPPYVSFFKENRTRAQAVEMYRQRIENSEEIYKKFSREFEIRACPICGEDESIPIDKFNDQYGITKCTKCSSIFVNPSPNIEALDYYYNNCDCNRQLGELYKDRAKKKGLILSERTYKVFTLITKLLERKPYINVLEVGCGSGAFLHHLKLLLEENKRSHAVNIVGIDIDAFEVSNPVDKDVNIYHSSAEEFVDRSKLKFDLVVHFELIEHLYDPFVFCRALHELLEDQGLMYFHTPNALGLDNQVLSYNDFRPLAHGIFPPMHLNSFTTVNVMTFLIRSGFRVNEIETPGNFDVDIIRQFNNPDSHLSVINDITDEKSLAIIQYLIKELGASSHLAVLASK